MVDSPHNHLATAEQQRPFTERSTAWLNNLVNGRQPVVRSITDRPDQSVARQDANSRLAHEQLVAKARQGKIDVYFVGDSITRRWGCTDPQYANLLANWKANFYGWNAGNFGWGGDTTQNILWRLQNSELDGVQPKVIVIQAGANNVPAASKDVTCAGDIARGIDAIVDACRQKAPSAHIVLTAIFPRSDQPNLNSIIDQVNANIAALAQQKKIHFLNVNPQLTGDDGQLLEGMMVDGLHPTVRGYQVWADGLKPILTELLGTPAKTDSAPPPTGDPSVLPIK